jgi:hypothetical protein
MNDLVRMLPGSCILVLPFERRAVEAASIAMGALFAFGLPGGQALPKAGFGLLISSTDYEDEDEF